MAKKTKPLARPRTTRSAKPTARRGREPRVGEPPPRIARIAKGKKPLYFSDPAIDKLLWMTMTLMEELSVTRDRLDTVERLLESRRLLRRRDIESYVPRGAAERERNARRAAYVDRMIRALEAELEEIAGTRRDAVAEDPVAAVSS